MSQLPLMCDLRQRFDAPNVGDIRAAINDELASLPLEKIRPGETVALTAGSRGIANISQILRETGQLLKAIGALPFVVPSMGSHGGGTVEGQLDVLRNLGITEQSVEMPIRATMDTAIVAETETGIPVHIDRFAFEADHVLVIGRIKPHTRFVGPIESGLHKMMLIGLGNHNGAETYHQAILSHSFPEIIDSVAEQVLAKCRVIGGLAILENSLDQTALIEAVRAENFAKREAELLKLACEWLPTLPFAEVDLLIVDQIGKNISGVGMDANVVGRKFNDHAATEDDIARCLRIFVRSLTDETSGNATGIGMAEFTTAECVSQIDIEKTQVNCITSNHPEAAMIPITLATDRQAVEAGLRTIGRTAPENARIIQIKDTLHLANIRISEAYFPLVEAASHLELIGDPYPMPFDQANRLANVE